MSNESGGFWGSNSADVGLEEMLNSSKSKVKIGEKYNWKGQSDRLIYVGHNWSGNGYWHQFEKVDAPGIVWCEVSTSDLDLIEESNKEE